MFQSFQPDRVSWQSASARGFSAAPEIHIWQLPIQREKPEGRQLLSTAEVERLEAMPAGAARNGFYSARLGLRSLLGDYLSVAAHAVRLHIAKQGKPHIDPAQGDIHFNLSHTDGMILLAISKACPLGIDVERLRRINGQDKIARKLFSSTEFDAIQAADNRQLAFFERWTALEARQKLDGKGIFGLRTPPSRNVCCEHFMPGPEHIATCCHRHDSAPLPARFILWQGI